ncbi:hypothetical protein Lfu02_55060 [Longispora fulva]|uniref:Uncharacterized protein n=1 Tax=Longispora fulva TaxID=619741 RepID=A0A8J7GIT5_9ACTN|nr:hypothetical protein [Longispora fulva]MBG6137512.1 hypothetical protein [Longispora fulva]GIG61134.1 hypothetical protein Lfu02_55060 [Longispora fulva]
MVDYGSTPNLGIAFPLDTAPFNPQADMETLARSIDTKVSAFVPQTWSGGRNSRAAGDPVISLAVNASLQPAPMKRVINGGTLNASGGVVVPTTGLYLVLAVFAFDGTGAAATSQFFLSRDNAATATNLLGSSTASTDTCFLFAPVALNAGVALYLKVNSGRAITTALDRDCYLLFTRIGATPS